MDYKNLEEKTLDKLKQELKVPDGFSWAELEPGIHRPMEKPYRKWFIYLLGVVLGIVIIAIVYNSNKAKNNGGGILPNTSVESSIESVPKESSLQDSKQEINISGLAEANKSLSNDSSDLKFGASIKEEKIDESISALDEQRSTKNLPLTIKNQHKSYSVEEAENQMGNLSAQKSNLKSNTIPYVTGIVEPRTKDISGKLTKHLNKLPLVVSQVKHEADYKMIPQYQLVDNLSSISVPSKWILGISSGLNVIDYKVSSSINGYSNILEQARSKRFGHSFGLNISYQFAERFAVIGALEHHILRERIEYTHCDTIKIIQNNVPIYTSINEFSGNTHTTFGIRSTNAVQKRTIREINQYITTEASLRLSYLLFSSKNLDLKALGGIGTTRRQSKGKYIDSNLAIVELSNSNFLNKTSYSSVAILGLRFETDINQLFSFNWGFTHRRHLRDWTPNDEMIIRPSTLNLDVGFRMRL